LLQSLRLKAPAYTFRRSRLGKADATGVHSEGVSEMRVLAIGLAVALLVFALTGGHVLFLPLLFLPLGLFSLGHKRRREPMSWRRGGLEQ
jgi:hypothetical protein